MKFALPLFASAVIIDGIAAHVDKSGLRAHREARAKIVGGETAGSYPAYAKLSSDTSSFCGSTLIHPDILISAAHCDGYVGDKAYLGSNKVDGSDADEVISIVAERSHPRYSRDDYPDIMLYKLERPSSATPVSMNANSGIPSNNELVRTIGFGLTSDGGEVSNSLLKVDVNVVNFNTCNQAYNNELAKSDMICAAAPGKDSCQNDSGGPLFRQDGTLVGIVSFGDGCARAGSPGVYARVSGSMDFIRQGICEMSSDPPSNCGAPTPTPPIGGVGGDSVGGGASTVCFSGQNQVRVQGKGTILMRDVQLGDKVESSSGFSPVYSFLHIDHDMETSFLKFNFHSHEEDVGSLEISPLHFVSSNGIMIGAKDVKVGDILDGESNSVKRVSSIVTVKRRGIYAPATLSGDLVVSGVLASNYVSLLDAAAVHEHAIAHAYMAPLRGWCTWTACHTESYTPQSFSTFVFPLIAIGKFLSVFPLSVQYLATAVIAPAVGLVYILDTLFFYQVTIVALILGRFMIHHGANKPAVKAI